MIRLIPLGYVITYAILNTKLFMNGYFQAVSIFRHIITLSRNERWIRFSTRE